MQWYQELLQDILLHEIHLFYIESTPHWKLGFSMIDIDYCLLCSTNHDYIPCLLHTVAFSLHNLS
jgi:hypothetical protein